MMGSRTASDKSGMSSYHSARPDVHSEMSDIKTVDRDEKIAGGPSAERPWSVASQGKGIQPSQGTMEHEFIPPNQRVSGEQPGLPPPRRPDSGGSPIPPGYGERGTPVQPPDHPPRSVTPKDSLGTYYGQMIPTEREEVRNAELRRASESVPSFGVPEAAAEGEGPMGAAGTPALRSGDDDQIRQLSGASLTQGEPESLTPAGMERPGSRGKFRPHAAEDDLSDIRSSTGGDDIHRISGASGSFNDEGFSAPRREPTGGMQPDDRAIAAGSPGTAHHYADQLSYQPAHEITSRAFSPGGFQRSPGQQGQQFDNRQSGGQDQLGVGGMIRSPHQLDEDEAKTQESAGHTPFPHDQQPATQPGGQLPPEQSQPVAQGQYPDWVQKYLDKDNRQPSQHEHPGTGHEFPAQGQSEQYPGKGSQYPGQGEQQLGQGSQYPGQGEQYPGQGSQYPGQSEQYPGQGSQYPGQSEQYPGQGSQYPGQSEQYPGQGSQYPGQSEQYPGQGSQYPGQSEQYPGKGSHYPGQGEQQPGQGSQYPGQDEQYPGKVSQYPGQDGGQSQYPDWVQKYLDKDNRQPSQHEHLLPDHGTPYPGTVHEFPAESQQTHGQQQPFPGKGSQYPGEDQQHPGQGSQYPGQGKQYPGKGSQYPGQGEQYPGKGSQYPGQGEQQPGKGSQYPGQEGQYPGKSSDFQGQEQEPPSHGTQGQQFRPHAAEDDHSDARTSTAGDDIRKLSGASGEFGSGFGSREVGMDEVQPTPELQMAGQPGQTGVEGDGGQDQSQDEVAQKNVPVRKRKLKNCLKYMYTSHSIFSKLHL